MMKVRYIQMSPKDENLNTESIVFTDDFDSPASEWLNAGDMVYVDKVIDMQVPVAFPLNHIFTRGF